ncbi:peptidase inhibitor family I36 protein [Streptomyces sp. NPDC046853]|uniref:peptidase inhibitor family I36 protein n=1 Tax=Streptomyces sp. NPDC046853 TaxID=3154920 RepID=UPI0033F32AA8
MTNKTARFALAGVTLLGLMSVAPSAAGATKEGAESGIRADYNGRTIQLSDGWDGAKVCAQMAVGDVRCFDDDAAYRAAMNLPAADNRAIGTASVYDCPPAWMCLWDNRAYTGRRLQWRDPGSFDLSRWDFRNRANSVANRKVQGGFALRDVDPFLPRTLFVGAGSAVRDLGAEPGNWNNKVDQVRT